jgi:hypothetical protein
VNRSDYGYLETNQKTTGEKSVTFFNAAASTPATSKEKYELDGVYYYYNPSSELCLRNCSG